MLCRNFAHSTRADQFPIKAAVYTAQLALLIIGSSIFMKGPSTQMRRPSGEAQAPQMPTPHFVR